MSGGEHVESWILGAFPSTQRAMTAKAIHVPRTRASAGNGKAPAPGAGCGEPGGPRGSSDYLLIIYSLYRFDLELLDWPPARDFKPSGGASCKLKKHGRLKW